MLNKIVLAAAASRMPGAQACELWLSIDDPDDLSLNSWCKQNCGSGHPACADSSDFKFYEICFCSDGNVTEATPIWCSDDARVTDDWCEDNCDPFGGDLHPACTDDYSFCTKCDDCVGATATSGDKEFCVPFSIDLVACEECRNVYAPYDNVGIIAPVLVCDDFNVANVGINVDFYATNVNAANVLNNRIVNKFFDDVGPVDYNVGDGNVFLCPKTL